MGPTMPRQNEREAAGLLFEEPEAALVKVAVAAPVRRLFTYRLPAELRDRVEIGSRVAVPFGRRKLAGFVVEITSRAPRDTAIKEVAGLLDAEPIFSPELLAFLREASSYYLHPLGEVLRAASPAMPTEAIGKLRRAGFLAGGENLAGARLSTQRVTLVRIRASAVDAPRLGKNQQLALELLRERKELTLHELHFHLKNPRSAVESLRGKGLVETFEREAPADLFFSTRAPSEPAPELNRAQKQAVDAIVRALNFQSDRQQAEETPFKPAAFLLHGVTGSGKTEVYLRVIAAARAHNLGALVLVPEIALTPQLVARFRARFGDAIAVLHSGLSPRERNNAWRALQRGEVDLAIGARSALFAPVQRLGVIIVDEEHDDSFKQETGFRYHARDMALLRAYRAGAIAVLGSATPSLESYFRAEQGKLHLLRLPDRATSQPLPRVEIVDLARHRQGPSGHPYLTGPLHHALDDCLQAGGQAIVFLNRRGFAPSVVCRKCGEPIECPACSVALTAHRNAGLLRCHYCDYSTAILASCRHCSSTDLEQLGLGTERLQETLSEVFPAARVARLDRDTAAGEGIEKVLQRLKSGKIDILVGTQMVAKGHDFPGVTLVGVVLADQSLAFPDFRASERTFQLLAQVAGRAGRGQQPGRVIIQSYQPNHCAVRCAAAHDFLGFYRVELDRRRELLYPPFSRMAAVHVDAAAENAARSAAQSLAAVALQHDRTRDGLVRILGPAAAPIARLRGRYRFRILLRSADRAALHQVAESITARIDRGIAPARASLDLDPVSML